MDQEMEASYSPVRQQPMRGEFSWLGWWRGLAWKPIYAAAVVVIGIALVIGAAVFLNRRADNFQAKQGPTPDVNRGAPGQTPTPHNRPGNSPSPPATPNESSVENPNNPATSVALNDRVGMVMLDKAGKLSGLDNVPAPTQDEIAKVLLSERIERPAILKDLAGQDSSLRGSNSAPPFKLTSPSRTAIITDRPALKWDKAPGASSYRVYVNDPAGREVARSEELPPERTKWILPKPVKRGEVYTWTVVAIADGKEIVSPGPSSPEMKFQVISSGSLRQLNKLKKARSHLALGVFYVRVGLLADAEREFQQLVRLNPESKVASKLLRTARLIRRQHESRLPK
jgi:hypothetical protein